MAVLTTYLTLQTQNSNPHEDGGYGVKRIPTPHVEGVNERWYMEIEGTVE